MNKDARVDTSFPDHPKTLQLERALGADGPWALIRLWLWVAKHRPDGSLTGLADHDIEVAIRWRGAAHKIMPALRVCGFVDGPEFESCVRNWSLRNTWAANAEDRTEKARFAGLVKHYGEANARKILAREARAARKRNAQQGLERPLSLELYAPSPSPPPSPKDREDGIGTPQRNANGTRLPDDWPLTEHLLAEARKATAGRNGVDIAAEHAKFVDYWHGVPGQRGRKADWTATWRNWIRKATPTGAPHGNGSPTHRRPSLAEQTERDLEAIGGIPEPH